MKVAEFDFELPGHLIAQHPVSPRDKARLLHVGKELDDRRVGDLPALLNPGDILVVNDTEVIPARLTGRRRDAKIEVTLHKEIPRTGAQNGGWRAFARPARKLKPGDIIEFAADFSAEVTAKGDGGEVTLVFDCPDDAFAALLEEHGVMPLPPYIKRQPGGDNSDREDYQTMFAAHAGAVAAPTAGLHFTPGLMAALALRQIAVATVTLHVGAGTFLPIKAEDTGDHVMHAETGAISQRAARQINQSRDAGGRVIAVGSTVLRLIETAADETGRLAAFAGETDIFITPGYRFMIAELMVTNFHLPKSTLFMLVCAFAGTQRMKAAYDHAIAAGYRFYSYGDCCLLERENTP